MAVDIVTFPDQVLDERRGNWPNTKQYLIVGSSQFSFQSSVAIKVQVSLWRIFTVWRFWEKIVQYLLLRILLNPIKDNW